MKIAFVLLSLLVVLLASGCSDAPANPNSQGDIASNEQQFAIAVPWTVTVKQGEVRTAAVTLSRGVNFKQDVTVLFKVEGITVTPNKAVVKASAKPEVQLQIEAGKDAALGDYRVVVLGTPDRGNAVQAEFTVHVIAP